MFDTYEDEYYCFCEFNEPGDCPCTNEDDPDCTECPTCWDMNMHDCREAGCYGDNPNAHIELFGTYAPGSEFDDYYNS